MSGLVPYDFSVDLLKRQLGEFSSKANYNEKFHSLSGLDRWVGNLDIVGQLESHRGSIYTMAWSESGSLLASASDDCGLRIFKPVPDAISSAKFSLVKRIDSEVVLAGLAFAPNSGDRTLIGGGPDAIVRIFDIEKPEPIANLRGHTRKIRRIVTETSPYLFLTCGDDGTVRQWDRRIQKPCSTIAYRPGAELLAASVSPSQPHYLVVGGTKRTCLVYDRRMTSAGPETLDQWPTPKSFQHLSSRCVKQFPDLGRTASDVKISNANPDNVAVSWVDGPVQVFSISRQNSEPRLASLSIGAKRKRSTNHPSRSRDLSRRDTVTWRSVTAEDGGDSDHESELKKPSFPPYNVPMFSGHRNSRSFKEICFLGPRDELIASGCDSGHLFIWERASGKLAQLLRVGIDPITSVKPHPTQPLIAVGSLGTTISLFSPDARDQVAEMERAAAHFETQPDLVGDGPFAILRQILGQVIADDDANDAAGIPNPTQGGPTLTSTAPATALHRIRMPVFANDPPENLPSRRRLDCAEQVIARNDILRGIPLVRIYFGSGRPELRLAVGTTVHLAINGRPIAPAAQTGPGTATAGLAAPAERPSVAFTSRNHSQRDPMIPENPHGRDEGDDGDLEDDDDLQGDDDLEDEDGMGEDYDLGDEDGVGEVERAMTEDDGFMDSLADLDHELGQGDAFPDDDSDSDWDMDTGYESDRANRRAFERVVAHLTSPSRAVPEVEDNPVQAAETEVEVRVGGSDDSYDSDESDYVEQ